MSAARNTFQYLLFVAEKRVDVKSCTHFSDNLCGHMRRMSVRLRRLCVVRYTTPAAYVGPTWGTVAGYLITVRWYGDGAGHTYKENSSVFSLIQMHKLPPLLWHCWLGGRKGMHLACKKRRDGGGWHWLVRMEWRPAGWSVCLRLLIFPCTTKSRSSLLALAHPGGPGKRAVKRLCLIGLSRV